MGEPYSVSQKQRAETRALAAKIVESVREDAEMPLGIPSYNESHLSTNQMCDRTRVEDLAFQLAQEIELLQADYERMQRQEQFMVDLANKRITELTAALNVACDNLEARNDIAQRRHVAVEMRRVATKEQP